MILAKKMLKWFALLIGTAALISAIIFLLARLAPKPPLQEIEYARLMLAEASKSRADTYSRQLYSEAVEAFDSAMTVWKRENRRFIFFRDYDKVESFARLSAEKSRKAAASSISNSTNLQSKLKIQIDTLRKTKAVLDTLFGRYPLDEELRARISRGKMLLRESEVAYGRGQYIQANRKLADAEYLLTGVYENANENLRAYFKSFPVWKKWVQAAISESRKNNSYSIIVDKFSRKCYLYLGGIIRYEFNAELGRNWVGDKRRMGDKATPEGIYRIVRKYQGRETPYHKALAIDYPNSEDRESFSNEVASGTLPSSARIGGGIEIHGGGGKGVDWTEGCVALRNREIDIVYNLVKVGTPVTIVGSMKDLDEILVR